MRERKRKGDRERGRERDGERGREREREEGREEAKKMREKIPERMTMGWPVSIQLIQGTEHEQKKLPEHFTTQITPNTSTLMLFLKLNVHGHLRHRDHYSIPDITYNIIPYRGKVWRALNLANWFLEGIGEI